MRMEERRNQSLSSTNTSCISAISTSKPEVSPLATPEISMGRYAIHGHGEAYIRTVFFAHQQVSVCWRDPASTGKQLPTKQTAQYKLGDKSVQIFSKGLSKAVL